MTAKFHLANTDDLITAYLGGKSEYALSLERGVATNVIRRILLENGITPRSHSAAGLVRAAQMTDSERKAQVAAAHVAATGREKTFAEKCLTAESRQKNGTTISSYERTLSTMLLDRGIESIHQQAIGPYNCDLGISPVAVEVFGGHWHWAGDHLRRTPKRINYFLDAGWHILIIPVGKSSPLTAKVADYVVAYIENARRNPSAPREYRVVWRAGEFVTIGSLNDNNLTIEPPFTNRRNPVTGRYETVAS